MFDDFFRTVEGAGIALVPSSLASLPEPNGAVSAFVIQPALSRAELLPSVLETKRAAGAQTFAVDGYASIERRGHGCLPGLPGQDTTRPPAAPIPISLAPPDEAPRRIG